MRYLQPVEQTIISGHVPGLDPNLLLQAGQIQAKRLDDVEKEIGKTEGMLNINSGVSTKELADKTVKRYQKEVDAITKKTIDSPNYNPSRDLSRLNSQWTNDIDRKKAEEDAITSKADWKKLQDFNPDAHRYADDIYDYTTNTFKQIQPGETTEIKPNRYNYLSKDYGRDFKEEIGAVKADIDKHKVRIPTSDGKFMYAYTDGDKTANIDYDLFYKKILPGISVMDSGLKGVDKQSVNYDMLMDAGGKYAGELQNYSPEKDRTEVIDGQEISTSPRQRALADIIAKTASPHYQTNEEHEDLTDIKNSGKNDSGKALPDNYPLNSGADTEHFQVPIGHYNPINQERKTPTSYEDAKKILGEYNTTPALLNILNNNGVNISTNLFGDYVKQGKEATLLDPVTLANTYHKTPQEIIDIQKQYADLQQNVDIHKNNLEQVLDYAEKRASKGKKLVLDDKGNVVPDKKLEEEGQKIAKKELSDFTFQLDQTLFPTDYSMSDVDITPRLQKIAKDRGVTTEEVRNIYDRARAIDKTKADETTKNIEKFKVLAPLNPELAGQLLQQAEDKKNNYYKNTNSEYGKFIKDRDRAITDNYKTPDFALATYIPGEFGNGIKGQPSVGEDIIGIVKQSATSGFQFYDNKGKNITHEIVKTDSGTKKLDQAVEAGTIVEDPYNNRWYVRLTKGELIPSDKEGTKTDATKEHSFVYADVTKMVHSGVAKGKLSPQYTNDVNFTHDVWEEIKDLPIGESKKTEDLAILKHNISPDLVIKKQSKDSYLLTLPNGQQTSLNRSGLLVQLNQIKSLLESSTSGGGSMGESQNLNKRLGL